MNDVAGQKRTPCARRTNVCRVLAGFLLLPALAVSATAATYNSANFDVSASSAAVAKQVAEIAEDHRRQFANEWLGVELQDWDSPCQIVVEERATGGQGWVSYESFQGRVQKLRIRVRGRLDHIAEYVLPHEVAHAVLAVTIGRPLPRWADEGVALLFEPESQRVRQRVRAAELVATDEIMPIRDILQLADYPDNRQHLIGFYTSCFSLSEYLVARGGKRRLLSFVRDGELYGWDVSVQRHYGSSLHELETAWKLWAPRLQGELPMNVVAVSQPVHSDAGP